MAENTKIEWTDATWNPITGCSVTSPGCKHCYAMQLAGTRLKHHESRAGLTQDTSAGPVWTGEVRFNQQWLDQPIRWTKPRMIFVCAHADLFHESVPDEWIDIVVGIMWACLYGRNGTPGHIFQVLTKRAARMRDYFSTDRREAWARAAVNYGGGIDPDGIWDQVMGAEGPHPRIWLGVSVEDQKRADERIPDLLATPAAVRWVSAEPLLGPVDLRFHIFSEPTGNFRTNAGKRQMELRKPADGGLHWVVLGGESGPKARPMHPQWARDLRDQCAEAGVPFLFKQWGDWAIASHKNGHFDSDMVRNSAYWIDRGGQMHKPSSLDLDSPIAMFRMGKKAAGRHLDGHVHSAFPNL